MTTVVDDQGRAILPFAPGDVLSVEQHGADVVILKRTQATAPPRPQLIQIDGELFSSGGGALTTDEVRRLLEDDL